jgi:DNA polymerase I-like protein with 3'-5' exonuclease and polymerase domains
MRIITNVRDLPDINPKDLFCDAETTSGEDFVEAFHPYLGHRACGWAFTWDDEKDAFYVPLRHRDPETENLPLEPVLRWFQEVLNRSKRWINHNVKFDAHFAHADGLSVEHLDLVCTAALAKTIDSDRPSHKLKPLCKDWLGMDMAEEKEVTAYLKGISGAKKVKDYGRIPSWILGRYACMDVIGNRNLWKHILKVRPEEAAQLWETEIALTKTLFRMEKRGMEVDPIEVRRESIVAITKTMQLAEEFEKLTSRELVDSSKLYHEVLCGRYGLPVLARTKVTKKNTGGGPSFDKHALAKYAELPAVVFNEELKRVVELILGFRNWQTYSSLFLESFVHFMDEDSRVHPNYNQTVRTGRMSCSDPPLQLGDARSTKLLVPGKGRAFLCGDASQAEFRVITHYTKDAAAIQALIEGVDYHDWVAQVCAIPRKIAKNINFAIAFGAGLKKIESMIVATLGQGSEKTAAEILRVYGERLPGIQKTAKDCERQTKKRGWIQNAYGRRRHLDYDFAYKAFNSLVQGCAMDMIKERMVFLDKSDFLARSGVRLLANKHDELVFDGEIEAIESPEVIKYITETLEDPSFEFRVPMVWDVKTSRESWYHAKP